LDREGNIEEKILTPEDFGLERNNAQDLLGGDAQANANALRAVLEGQKCAYRNIVLANTSAVLNIHASAETLEEGVQKAADVLDNGLVMDTLKDYISMSREAL
jgi:anthranilate phosphoribosyltransferase